MKTFVFLCQLCAICAYAVEAAPAPSTLRLVNAIYRHGDRSPQSIYPKDPYQEDFWPQGLGWLSEIGMRQQFALGQYLRSEYSNFLNSTYVNTEIAVNSSDEARCLMSASCNLAGLYPPSGAQVWNPSLLWQPIPVQTRPGGEDNVLSLKKKCARYDALFMQELQSPAVQQVQRANAAFYQFVNQSAGVNCNNIYNCWLLTDTLKVEMVYQHIGKPFALHHIDRALHSRVILDGCLKAYEQSLGAGVVVKCLQSSHNLTLPEWTRQTFNNVTAFSKLMEIRDWSFGLLYNGTEMSRLKGGPLLKELLQNMENAVSGSGSHYKMYMYSAHDSTLGAVMSAMSVYNNREPPYASMLLVELHSIGGVFCVKTRFRNETSGLPHIFEHPACQQECCPLNKYIEITKDRVPVDWDAECQNGAKTSKSDDSKLSVTAKVFIALFGVTILALAVLSVLYVRLRFFTTRSDNLIVN